MKKLFCLGLTSLAVFFTALGFAFAQTTPASPVIDPGTGNVIAINTEITISGEEGAELYYAQGTRYVSSIADPVYEGDSVTGYTKYDGASKPIITVGKMAIKAVALKDGILSEVATASWTGLLLESPELAPINGSGVPVGTEITISGDGGIANDENVKLYYCQGKKLGDIPEQPSTFLGQVLGYTEYTEQSKPTVDTVNLAIRAVAVYTDPNDMNRMFMSEATSALYRTGEKPATPEIDPGTGNMMAINTEITISGEEGAELYYAQGTRYVSSIADPVYEGDSVTGYTKYDGASKPIITVGKMAIKAVALKDGILSEVATASWTGLYLEVPTLDPVDGSAVPADTEITMTGDGGLPVTDTVKFYYCQGASLTNIAEPSTFLGQVMGYTEYTEETKPTVTSENLAIKVVAAYADPNDMNLMYLSEVVTAVYEIDDVANRTEELADVSVYPNPNNGSFTLRIPVRADVEVFAVNGVMVNRIEVLAGACALQLDNSGVYFVRVIAADGRVAIKRVVVR